MKIKIVLLGGGHANALALIQLAKNKHADLTLINDGEQGFYSGMIPGLISGQYSVNDLAINFSELCRKYDCNFIPVKAISIDSIAKVIILENNEILQYDILCINIGSTNKYKSLIQNFDFIIPTRPLHDLLIKIGNFQKADRIAIIGAGFAGIELAFALRSKYQNSEILIIQKGLIVPELSQHIRDSILTHLNNERISIIYNEVFEIKNNCIVLKSFQEILCDFAI